MESAGLGQQAKGLWRRPGARHLTEVTDAFRVGKRYLIPERDPRFRAEFRKTLEGRGVASGKLPPRSPPGKAPAQRFLRTLQETGWERRGLFGEGSWRKTIHNFGMPDHHERNPPGLDNRLLWEEGSHPRTTAAIHRRPRWGGRLNDDYRQPA